MTISFDEARAAYFDWLAPAKPAANTLAAKRSDIDVIARRIGDPHELGLDALSRDSIRRAFGAWSSDKAKTTILRALAHWRHFIGFLVAEGMVPGEALKWMDAVPSPRMPKSTPKALKGWDDDLVARLMTGLADGKRGGRHPWPELDVAIVATLLATGARASEFVGLNLDSVEGIPPHQTVTVKGKGGKERSIPIQPELDEVLGIYLEARRERYPRWTPKQSDPLFIAHVPSGKGGRRMTRAQLHYFLEEALRGCGLFNRLRGGAVAHAFRHTYGTMLAAEGLDVITISRLMGHDSIATTQRYIDSLQRSEREGAARNPIYGALSALRVTVPR